MNLQRILDVTIVVLMIAILTTLSLPVCIAVIQQRIGAPVHRERPPAPVPTDTVL